MFQSPVKSIAEVAAKALGGRIAMAKGDVDGALGFYRDAVAAEDKLNYDEPPDWYYPVRETLGAALVQAGKYAEAERVFREDLQKNPHNPRSLYGLSVALEKQHKSASATRAEFSKRWKGGTLSLAAM
jgi:Flp pilus assembly protein TadD